MPVINRLMVTSQTAGLDISGMTETFTDVYTALLNGLSSTSDWVFTAFIFAMVIILVYVVSRLSIDFAKENAIGLGWGLMIFSFILFVLVGEGSIGIGAFFMILLCGLIAEFFRLFDPVLDYQRAESVQFEDENYFYFVRMVPKIQLTRRKRVVRRIRPQIQEDDDE